MSPRDADVSEHALTRRQALQSGGAAAAGLGLAGTLLARSPSGEKAPAK
jgi:hypothetical protein